LLADPNGRLTPLRGNELWQIALLELWLQRHGISGAAA
jgi:asparagine synthase (glutamine-hydrolysing)